MITKPWSSQIELVEGCTRLCDFCGLNAIRSGAGNYKYMSQQVAEATAQQLEQLNPDIRVEFAMHGEPLVHPDAAFLLGIFRSHLPKTQIMVTTNGATLRKKGEERIRGLFKAGVDFIVLDTYYPERDELRAMALALPKDIQVLDYYDDLVPQGWSPYHNHKRKFRNMIVLMDDIGARDGENAARVILNHAGSNPTKPIPKEPLKSTCTNPFREITVAYNGNVNICCMDWKHEAVMGNVQHQTLSEIWYGQRFEAARAHLQNKDRTFDPCSKCDKGPGSRSGLLPKYDLPTQEQRDLLAKKKRLPLLV